MAATLIERVTAATKILSVRQPWPWAMFHAGKNIENRDWRTRLRGDVLIHAGKQFDAGRYEAQQCLYEWTASTPVAAPLADDLPRGGIVGIVAVTNCVDDSESEWFVGKFGFVIRNRQALPFVPCKGALGFFDVPADVRASLIEKVRA